MIFLVLLSCFNAISSGDEEALLHAKAALVARKILVRNLNLIGVNPTTCKPQDDKKLYIEQMKQIQSESLNHCSTLTDSVLKPLNDEIAKVDAGQLVYASIPQVAQSTRQVKEERGLKITDNSMEESRDPSESVPRPLVDSGKITSHTTGLSGEEIDRIFSNYEGNRKSYVTSEEDNLFDILSKAYVRNLNKLIEREDPSQ